MNPWYFCLLACFLLNLASPALAMIPATTPPPATNTVQLRFAWPAGLKGTATYQSTERVNNGTGEKNKTVSGTSTFTVKAVGEDLIIHQQSPSVTVQSSVPEQAATMQKLYEALGKVPLAFVVGRDGSYRRLDGLQEMRTAILTELEKSFAETLQQVPAADRQRVLGIVAGALSAEQLEALFVAQWNREVAQWIDADLEQGEWYELETSSKVPMFNNAEIPLTARFRYGGRTPCNAADKKLSCVTLEMQSVADPEIVRQEVGDFVTKLAGTSLPITFDDMQCETYLRIVTEPSTLLPYEVIFTEESSVILSVDGQSQETSKSEESVYRYTYER